LEDHVTPKWNQQLMEQNAVTTSGVTKEAASREERFQRASMAVGVPGETTASVHEPVAQEFHSRKDSVIIPAQLMEESTASASGRNINCAIHSHAQLVV